MSCPDVQLGILRLGALFALTVSALNSGSARADVMEIGAEGSRWVAVGRGLVPPTGGTPAPSTTAAGPLTHPSAMTGVANSAGPDKWRARIAYLAAKYDISPALLEAVIWRESNWNPSARSPVGAQGLAQLMPGTARDLGVDLHDADQNLEGGAKYLRMQLDAFNGNIEKALAAYNAGPRRVIRAGGVPPIQETQLYVAAIMARLSQPVRR